MLPPTGGPAESTGWAGGRNLCMDRFQPLATGCNLCWVDETYRMRRFRRPGSTRYQPAPKQANGVGSSAAASASASAYAGCGPAGQPPVVVRHQVGGAAVGHLGHAGDDRRRAAVQEGAGQPEGLVARPDGGLAEVAGRQHHLLRRVGHPVQVVADHRSVGQPDRGEQRVLPLVPAVGGDVHQLGAGDAVQERLGRRLLGPQGRGSPARSPPPAPPRSRPGAGRARPPRRPARARRRTGRARRARCWPTGRWPRGRPRKLGSSAQVSEASRPGGSRTTGASGRPSGATRASSRRCRLRRSEPRAEVRSASGTRSSASTSRSALIRRPSSSASVIGTSRRHPAVAPGEDDGVHHLVQVEHASPAPCRRGPAAGPLSVARRPSIRGAADGPGPGPDGPFELLPTCPQLGPVLRRSPLRGPAGRPSSAAGSSARPSPGRRRLRRHHPAGDRPGPLDPGQHRRRDGRRRSRRGWPRPPAGRRVPRWRSAGPGCRTGSGTRSGRTARSGRDAARPAGDRGRTPARPGPAARAAAAPAAGRG